jgi:hypothetical protein
LFSAKSLVPSVWSELSKYLLNEWVSEQTLIVHRLCSRFHANHYEWENNVGCALPSGRWEKKNLERDAGKQANSHKIRVKVEVAVTCWEDM